MTRILAIAVLVLSTATARARPHDDVVDASLRDDFAFALHEYTQEFTRTWMITRFHAFHVGTKCLARFPDRNMSVLASGAQVANHLVGYARKRGADDWYAIESQRNNDPKTNQKLVYKLMGELTPKLSLTINVEGVDCDAGSRALWIQYWVAIAEELEENPPKAGRVSIVLDVTPKTKGISAEVGRDGTFLFTASRDVEPDNWLETIRTAFRRGAR